MGLEPASGLGYPKLPKCFEDGFDLRPLGLWLPSGLLEDKGFLGSRPDFRGGALMRTRRKKTLDW